LVQAGEEYPFCYRHLAREKAQANAIAAELAEQGLKPG